MVPLNYLDSQNWKLLCSELFSFVYLVCFLCSTHCLSCLTFAHELAGLLLCLEVQGCAKELTRQTVRALHTSSIAELQFIHNCKLCID